MRVVYITAGAAGMYCGSCMRDNTLVSALISQGHDALLLPTYTPIRTDEDDVSTPTVFYGGVNVYLEQKFSLFRHTPWFLDRLLNARWLLNWVSRFAARTRAEELGELTISVLKGERGKQRKEIAKLVHWLEHDHRPEIINLTNVLLSGMVPRLKERLKVPVLASLQGDDIFLEALPTSYRAQALELIKQHNQQIDGFVATSAYYADFMSEYLSIPRHKIDVVYPGIKLKGYERKTSEVSEDFGSRKQRSGKPFTIGYFARICPEKGLHNLVDAFVLLKKQPGAETCRLRVSGWLGEHNRPYFAGLRQKLEEAGLAKDFEHVEAPDHASKVKFFQEIDVLSVPTVYREPKGLYLLEAWANGVPVVQPRHGSFPELIEATGGGLLVEPNDPRGLADALRQIMADPVGGAKMGRQGQDAVRERFHAESMARKTVDVYKKYLG